MAKTRRRNKLIDPALQLKLTFVFFGMACLGVMLEAALFYRAFVPVLEQTRNSSEVFAQLPQLLVSTIVMTLGILLPLAITVGVLITFRIAGPVYRFKQYLGQMISGQTLKPCVIRRRDELHDLCEVINEVSASYQALRSAQEDVEEQGEARAPAQAA